MVLKKKIYKKVFLIDWNNQILKEKMNLYNDDKIKNFKNVPYFRNIKRKKMIQLFYFFES